MGSQRGKIQTAALWVWCDLRYRRLSLSLRKFPMWEHRLHLAQTLPVTRYVGSFLLPVICRWWLHWVRTVLQFDSWVNEEGILKDTVLPPLYPPPPRGPSFGIEWVDAPHLHDLMTGEPTKIWGSLEQNSDILQTLKIIRSCCRTAGGRMSEYWRMRTHSEKYSRWI